MRVGASTSHPACRDFRNQTHRRHKAANVKWERKYSNEHWRMCCVREIPQSWLALTHSTAGALQKRAGSPILTLKQESDVCDDGGDAPCHVKKHLTDADAAGLSQ